MSVTVSYTSYKSVILMVKFLTAKKQILLLSVGELKGKLYNEVPSIFNSTIIMNILFAFKS